MKSISANRTDAIVSRCALLILMACACSRLANAQTKGETMTDPQNTFPLRASGDLLYRRPPANVHSRLFTFENLHGEKGKGGMARYGRKGSPAPMLIAGETFTFVDYEGSGTIRHIWITVDRHDLPEVMRGVRLEMYWDGAKTPAVNAPLGDFFCLPLGKTVPFQNALFSAPDARAFNCVIPMPFKKHAKMVAINETGMQVRFFYEVEATVGDAHGDDMLYFHSYWRRENPTTIRQDMTILPRVEGCGRYLGANMGIIQNPATNHMWWGEGEVKMYIDGDTDYPTICGTGSEDYVGAAWGQGLFDYLYHGNHYLSKEGEGMGAFHDRHGFYRLHVPDPHYFHTDMRVTIQNLGGTTGRQMLQALAKDPTLKFMKPTDGSEYFTREELEGPMLDAFTEVERADDFCATAYWYMDRPENGLPPLAPLAERIAGLTAEAPAQSNPAGPAH
jgi:hypothetical protein